MAFDQQWVLARFREDGSRNDPKFYTVKTIGGYELIWMNVNGNVGWYYPNIINGEIVDFRQEASGPVFPEETEGDRRVLNFALKYLSRKARKKIVDAVMEFRRINL